MEEMQDAVGEVTILDVLGVHICRCAILDLVDIKDIVRSERVSRRWQLIVHGYLDYCRSLTLCFFPDFKEEDQLNYYFNGSKTIPTDTYRTIDIRSSTSMYAREIIRKIGSSLVRLITNRDEEDFHTIIDLYCPHLQQISLKNILSEDRISKILQERDWEQIEIYNCVNWTGRCLNSIKLSNLKSLSVIRCPDIQFDCLYSVRNSLRNLTNLDFDNSGIENFLKVHIVLREMPKLEAISLCNYHGYPLESKEGEELIECLSQLENLKRLKMRYNYFVTSTLLEGLKKLQYLSVVR